MSARGKIFAVLCAAAGALVALAPFAARQIFSDEVFDGVFGDSLCSLPVQMGGRAMPLSSAAADVLKRVSGKSTAKIGGARVSATKWLWLMNGKSADMAGEKLLRTDSRDLQKLLSAKGRYVSYADVSEKYGELEKSASDAQGGVYARACADILEAAGAFANAADCFAADIYGQASLLEGVEKWFASVSEAAAEIERAQKNASKPDESKLVGASMGLTRLRELSKFEDADTDGLVKTIVVGEEFFTPARAMLDRHLSPAARELVKIYAALADAAAQNNKTSLAQLGKKAFEILKKDPKIDFIRIKIEVFYNAIDPFFAGLLLYAAAFLGFCAGGFWRGRFARCAAIFLSYAAVVHVLAIAARVYIQMRPPVTNFYSSVVFTGAVAAVFGLVMYVKKGSRLAALSASFCGLASLLIAVNLPHSGDTMGVMRAVLNSNFWLSAHVMTIMIGYCGLFLAGFAASFRLVGNAFSRGNFGMATKQVADGVYALLCGCLLFTFVGTMLGGVWADMSWGRFWGWDPKENGALMIVLWTAGAIHCRLLKICNDRMFLVLAALGNVVVAWAWFGVNLLGVGLHSYGFVDGGWTWFIIFVILQILVAPFGFLVYKDDNIILKK